MAQQLVGITHPTIIRKTVPAVIIDKFIYDLMKRGHNQVTWLYDYQDRSVEDIVSFPCPLYNVTDYRHDLQFCSQINLMRFYSHSKPWNREKYLRIFPPRPKDDSELGKTVYA